MKKKTHKDSLDLRSKKVRHIIGRMPSSLIYYGNAIFILSLFFIYMISYHIPYQKQYSGTIYVYNNDTLVNNYSDSIETTLLVSFNNNHPKVDNMNTDIIYFISPTKLIKGKILSLRKEKSMNNRYYLTCLIEEKHLKYLTIDMDFYFFNIEKIKNYIL